MAKSKSVLPASRLGIKRTHSYELNVRETVCAFTAIMEVSGWQRHIFNFEEDFERGEFAAFYVDGMPAVIFFPDSNTHYTVMVGVTHEDIDSITVQSYEFEEILGRKVRGKMLIRTVLNHTLPYMDI